MDQPLPDWFSNDFFTQCLQKEKGNPDITVINFTTTPAAPPGNSYGSFITKVKVEYKEGQDDLQLHSLSLIVKSELAHGPVKDVSIEFQQNEPSFYYNFIPEATKHMDPRFVPKRFFSPRPNVIVLEDLNEQGFIMADRTKQLDLNHCRLYMIAASTLHAVSVAVYKENPELLESIKNVKFFSSDSKTRDLFKLMIRSSMKCLASAIEKIEKFKKYSGIIREIIPHIWKMIVETDESPSDIVRTLRQGDSWTSNMMFKYDREGNVYDIKLIDFQFTSYGSPINDLILFIWTSANNDVLRHNLEELYTIYVDAFNENLIQMNCTERLTYQQVANEVKRLTPVVFFAIAELPPILDPQPEDLGESDDVVQIENSYKKSYNDYYCNNHLPNLLECLELHGVFDYLKSASKEL